VVRGIDAGQGAGVRTERSESVITMLALPDHGGAVPFQRKASDELAAAEFWPAGGGLVQGGC